MKFLIKYSQALKYILALLVGFLAATIIIGLRMADFIG
ncbi:MAG: hypothetical protein ACI81I_000081 [Arcobacteraceae bacterium]|jgi:hypothetical protein